MLICHGNADPHQDNAGQTVSEPEQSNQSVLTGSLTHTHTHTHTLQNKMELFLCIY